MKITNFKKILISIISGVVLFSSSVYGADGTHSIGTCETDSIYKDYDTYSHTESNSYAGTYTISGMCRDDYDYDTTTTTTNDDGTTSTTTTNNKGTRYNYQTLTFSGGSQSIGTITGAGSDYVTISGTLTIGTNIKSISTLYVSGKLIIPNNVTIQETVNLQSGGTLQLEGGTHSFGISRDGTLKTTGVTTLNANITPYYYNIDADTTFNGTSNSTNTKTTDVASGKTLTLSGTSHRLGDLSGSGSVVVDDAINTTVNVNSISSSSSLVKEGELKIGKGIVNATVGDMNSNSYVRATRVTINNTIGGSSYTATVVSNTDKWKIPTTIESGGKLIFTTIGTGTYSPITIKSGGILKIPNKDVLTNINNSAFFDSITIEPGGKLEYAGTLNSIDFDTIIASTAVLSINSLNLDLAQERTGKLGINSTGITFTGDIPDALYDRTNTLLTVNNLTVGTQATTHTPNNVKYDISYSGTNITATVNRFISLNADNLNTLNNAQSIANNIVTENLHLNLSNRNIIDAGINVATGGTVTFEGDMPDPLNTLQMTILEAPSCSMTPVIYESDLAWFNVSCREADASLGITAGIVATVTKFKSLKAGDLHAVNIAKSITGNVKTVALELNLATTNVIDGGIVADGVSFEVADIPNALDRRRLTVLEATSCTIPTTTFTTDFAEYDVSCKPADSDKGITAGIVATVNKFTLLNGDFLNTYDLKEDIAAKTLHLNLESNNSIDYIMNADNVSFEYNIPNPFVEPTVTIFTSSAGSTLTGPATFDTPEIGYTIDYNNNKVTVTAVAYRIIQAQMLIGLDANRTVGMQQLNINLAKGYVETNATVNPDSISLSGYVAGVEDNSSYSILSSGEMADNDQLGFFDTTRARYSFEVKDNQLQVNTSYLPFLLLNELNIEAAYSVKAYTKAQAELEKFRLIKNPTQADIDKVQALINAMPSSIDIATIAKEAYDARVAFFGEASQQSLQVATTTDIQDTLDNLKQNEIDSDANITALLNDANNAVISAQNNITAAKAAIVTLKAAPDLIARNLVTEKATIDSDLATLKSLIDANLLTLIGQIDSNLSTLKSSIDTNLTAAIGTINTDLATEHSSIDGNLTVALALIDTNLAAALALIDDSIDENSSEEDVNASIVAKAEANTTAVSDRNTTTNTATGEKTAATNIAVSDRNTTTNTANTAKDTATINAGNAKTDASEDANTSKSTATTNAGTAKTTADSDAVTANTTAKTTAQDIITTANNQVTAAKDAIDLYTTTTTNAGEAVQTITAVGNVEQEQLYITALIDINSLITNANTTATTANAKNIAAKTAVDTFLFDIDNPTAANITTVQNAINEANLANEIANKATSSYNTGVSWVDANETAITEILPVTSAAQANIVKVAAKILPLQNASDLKATALQSVTDAKTLVDVLTTIKYPTPSDLANVDTAIAVANTAITTSQTATTDIGTASATAMQTVIDEQILKDMIVLEVFKTAVVKTNDVKIAIDQSRTAAYIFQAIKAPTQDDIATVHASSQVVKDAIIAAQSSLSEYQTIATANSVAQDSYVFDTLTLLELLHKTTTTSITSNIVLLEGQKALDRLSLVAKPKDEHLVEEKIAVDTIMAIKYANDAKDAYNAAATDAGVDAEVIPIIATAEISSTIDTIMTTAVNIEIAINTELARLATAANTNATTSNTGVETLEGKMNTYLALPSADQLTQTNLESIASDINTSNVLITTAEDAKSAYIAYGNANNRELGELTTINKHNSDLLYNIYKIDDLLDLLNRVQTADTTAAKAMTAAQTAIATFRTISNPTAEQNTAVQTAMDDVNNAVSLAKIVSDAVKEAGMSSDAQDNIATKDSELKVLNALYAVILKENEAAKATSEAKIAADEFALIDSPSDEDIATLEAANEKAKDAMKSANEALAFYEATVAQEGQTLDIVITAKLALSELYNKAITLTISANIDVIAGQVVITEVERIAADSNLTEQQIEDAQVGIDAILAVEAAEAAVDEYTAAATAAAVDVVVAAVGGITVTGDINTIIGDAIAAEKASDLIIAGLLTDANTKAGLLNVANIEAKSALENYNNIENQTEEDFKTLYDVLKTLEDAKVSDLEASSKYRSEAISQGETVETTTALEPIGSDAQEVLDSVEYKFEKLNTAKETAEISAQAVLDAQAAVATFKDIDEPTPDDVANMKQAIKTANVAILAAKTAAQGATEAGVSLEITNATIATTAAQVSELKVMDRLYTSIEKEIEAKNATKEAKEAADVFAAISDDNTTIPTAQDIATLEAANEKAKVAMKSAKEALTTYEAIATQEGITIVTPASSDLELADKYNDAITLTITANIAVIEGQAAIDILAAIVAEDGNATAEQIEAAKAGVDAKIALDVAQAAVEAYETAAGNDAIETSAVEELSIDTNTTTAITDAITAEKESDAIVLGKLNNANDKADLLNAATITAQAALDVYNNIAEPTVAQLETLTAALDALETAKTNNEVASSEYITAATDAGEIVETITTIEPINEDAQDALDSVEDKVYLLSKVKAEESKAAQAVINAQAAVTAFKAIGDPTPEEIAVMKKAVKDANIAILAAKTAADEATQAGLTSTAQNNIAVNVSKANVINGLYDVTVKDNEAKSATSEAKIAADIFATIVSPTPEDIAALELANTRAKIAMNSAKDALTSYIAIADQEDIAINTTAITADLVLAEKYNKAITLTITANIAVVEGQVAIDKLATIVATGVTPTAEQIAAAQAGVDAVIALETAQTAVDVYEAAAGNNAIATPVVDTLTIEDDVGGVIANAIVEEKASDDEIARLFNTANEKIALLNTATKTAESEILTYNNIVDPTPAQMTTLNEALGLLNVAKKASKEASAEYTSSAINADEKIETITTIEPISSDAQVALYKINKPLFLVTNAINTAQTAQEEIDAAKDAMDVFRTIQNPTPEEIATVEVAIEKSRVAIEAAKTASEAATKAGLSSDSEIAANASKVAQTKVMDRLYIVAIKEKEAIKATQEAKAAADTFALIENPTAQDIATLEAVKAKAKETTKNANEALTLYEAAAIQGNVPVDTTVISALGLNDKYNEAITLTISANIAVSKGQAAIDTLAAIAAGGNTPSAQQLEDAKAGIDALIALEVANAAVEAYTTAASIAGVEAIATPEVEIAIIPVDLGGAIAAAIEEEKESDAHIAQLLNAANENVDKLNAATIAAQEALVTYNKIKNPTKEDLKALNEALKVQEDVELLSQETSSEYKLAATNAGEKLEKTTTIEEINKDAQDALDGLKDEIVLLNRVKEEQLKATKAMKDSQSAMVVFRTIQNPTAQDIATVEAAINEANIAILEAKKVADEATKAGLSSDAQDTINNKINESKVVDRLYNLTLKENEVNKATAEAKAAADVFAAISDDNTTTPSAQDIATLEAANEKAKVAMKSAKEALTIYETTATQAGIVVDTDISTDLALAEKYNKAITLTAEANIAVVEGQAAIDILAKIVAEVPARTPTAEEMAAAKTGIDAILALEVAQVAVDAYEAAASDANVTIIETPEVDTVTIPADANGVIAAAILAEKESDAQIARLLNTANEQADLLNSANIAAQAALENYNNIIDPTKEDLDILNEVLKEQEEVKLAAKEATDEYALKAQDAGETVETITTVEPINSEALVALDKVKSKVEKLNTANETATKAQQAILNLEEVTAEAKEAADVFALIVSPTAEDIATLETANKKAKEAVEAANVAIEVASNAAMVIDGKLDIEILNDFKLVSTLNDALVTSSEVKIAILESKKAAEVFALIDSPTAAQIKTAEDAMDKSNKAMVKAKAAAILYTNTTAAAREEVDADIINNLELVELYNEAITLTVLANIAVVKGQGAINTLADIVAAGNTPTAQQIAAAKDGVDAVIAQELAQTAVTAYTDAATTAANNDASIIVETAPTPVALLIDTNTTNAIAEAVTSEKISDAIVKDLLDKSTTKANVANIAIEAAQVALEAFEMIENPSDEEKLTLKIALELAAMAIKDSNTAADLYNKEADLASEKVETTITLNTNSSINTHDEYGTVTFNKSKSLDFMVENNTFHQFEVKANGKDFTWKIEPQPKNGKVEFIQKLTTLAELKYTPTSGTSKATDRFKIVMTDNNENSTSHTIDVSVNIVPTSIIDFSNVPEDNDNAYGDVEIEFTEDVLDLVVTTPNNTIVKKVANFIEIKKEAIISSAGSSDINIKVYDNGYSDLVMKTTNSNSEKKARVNMPASGGDIIFTDSNIMGNSIGNSGANMRFDADVDGSVEHIVEVAGEKVSKTTALADLQTLISGVVTTIGDTITLITQTEISTTVEVEQKEFIIKAVSTTKDNGTTQTKFIKVNNNTGVETAFDQLLDDSTPYSAGATVDIKNIDGILYFHAIADLTDNLIIK